MSSSPEQNESAIKTDISPQIDQEYVALVPQLAEAQYQALKESIRENGQISPIMVNEMGAIIDGHHRYRACRELGLQPRFLVRKFADRLAEKTFAIECNLIRRHANAFQLCEAVLKLEPVERERARLRQLKELMSICKAFVSGQSVIL